MIKKIKKQAFVVLPVLIINDTMSETTHGKKELLEQKISKEQIILACSIVFSFLISLLIEESTEFRNYVNLSSKTGIFAAFITLMITCLLLFIFSYRRSKDMKSIWNELNSVERMKDEFISNMRHEFKTPLNPIKGYSEMLFEEGMGPITDIQRVTLEKIIENTLRLEKRIDLLVFLSIASSGKLEYSFDLLRMEDILNQIVIETKPQINDKKLILKTEYASDIPLICGDGTYLIEAFRQVMDNAIKFTSSDNDIIISAYKGYKSVHIKIIDNGIGIRDNQIENLFQRFYQIDGSKSRKYNGNGLGLYISKTIVEAHEGEIWIESEEGTGTTVHVKLPIPNIKKETTYSF